MQFFGQSDYDNHEKVVFINNKASGLKAIIAIHNTALGPALGGCRMYPYANENAALTDALRLSRGMTYKSAMAGLPLGGGKSVIIGNPVSDKSDALFNAMAHAVNDLNGDYIVAQDSGTSVADMLTMKASTAHIAGGDSIENEYGEQQLLAPSPSTALGVFKDLRPLRNFGLAKAASVA